MRSALLNKFRTECRFRSRKMMIIATLLFLSMVLSVNVASAQEGDQPEETAAFLNMGNWVLSIEAQTFERFLQYDGSPLASPTRVRVWYRLKNGNNWSENKLYEDLWFHQGKAIGLHRYCDLSKLSQQVGYINVRASSTVTMQPLAIANAISRLFMDLKVLRAIMLEALVPIENYSQVSSALTDLGFSKISTNSSPTSLTFQLGSKPSDYGDYFKYEAQRN